MRLSRFSWGQIRGALKDSGLRPAAEVALRVGISKQLERPRGTIQRDHDDF